MDITLERILDCMGPRHGAGTALAEHLGISPNVITNWKNGSLHSYRKYLPQIADYYGVSAEWLRGENVPRQGGSVEKNPDDPDAVTFDDFTYAMHNEGKELTQENRQMLLEMARFLRQQQLQEKREKEENKQA